MMIGCALTQPKRWENLVLQAMEGGAAVNVWFTVCKRDELAQCKKPLNNGSGFLEFGWSVRLVSVTNNDLVACAQVGK